MKTRFTGEQIIAMIKKQESGEKTANICRRHGISSATFYKYKSKYNGMKPSDPKRLRVLEDENGKLKRLLAEQMLDNALLRESKSKTVTPVRKRKAVAHLMEPHQFSQRRLPCGPIGKAKSVDRARAITY
jgi:putative transposase